MCGTCELHNAMRKQSGDMEDREEEMEIEEKEMEKEDERG